jgi:hypothetical protein
VSCSWSIVQGSKTLPGPGQEGEGLADALISTWRTSQQEQSTSAEAQFCELQQHAAWIFPSMRQEYTAKVGTWHRPSAISTKARNGWILRIGNHRSAWALSIQGSQVETMLATVTYVDTWTAGPSGA